MFFVVKTKQKKDKKIVLAVGVVLFGLVWFCFVEFELFLSLFELELS